MSSLHRRRREGGAPARQVECFCVKVRSDCIIRIDIHHTKGPPPVRLRLTLPALRGLERKYAPTTTSRDCRTRKEISMSTTSYLSASPTVLCFACSQIQPLPPARQS